jgi:hypothetical protein
MVNALRGKLTPLNWNEPTNLFQLSNFGEVQSFLALPSSLRRSQSFTFRAPCWAVHMYRYKIAEAFLFAGYTFVFTVCTCAICHFPVISYNIGPLGHYFLELLPSIKSGPRKALHALIEVLSKVTFDSWWLIDLIACLDSLAQLRTRWFAGFSSRSIAGFGLMWNPSSAYV